MPELWLEDLRFSIPAPDGSTYTFGRYGLDEVVILTGGWDVGDDAWKVQDAQPPGSDIIMVGRDDITPPTWTLSVLVERDGDVMAALDRLKWVWRGGTTRRTPGAALPLSYARAGQQRMVYGRPRRFTIEPPEVWSDDFALATLEFKLTDPTVYGGGDRWSQTLSLAQPARAGWIWGAFDYPWPSGVFGIAERQGVLEVGSAPVSFAVEFRGDPAVPTAGATLLGPGWKIALREPLRPGQVVTVDTQARSVLVDGERKPALTADSTLAATLPDGQVEVVFTADAPTGATATVSWRPGYVSI